jgi:hypothetical protein
MEIVVIVDLNGGSIGQRRKQKGRPLGRSAYVMLCGNNEKWITLRQDLVIKHNG